MKEKIKLDQYAVYEKGRVYEVLVFPFIENMYVYCRTKGDFDERAKTRQIRAFQEKKLT